MAARKRKETITLGVVNIFLGGTGKYIAEELKGQQAHYGLSLPEYIAFDLSRETTHTGAFALGHDLLAPHEQFAATTMDKTAPDWADLDAGDGLAPLPPHPGPRTRPEAVVMRQIANEMKLIEPPSEGLWGLRAAGLLAFATFMDPKAAGPEARAAIRFRDRVSGALRAAGRDGDQITVSIVASTAGGTGAGMFLPLAWYLHDHPVATSIEINLVLITSSAFDNEPLDAGVNQLEMQTKGRSGTFAIIRELELLESADSRTSFANRRFPIRTDNPTGELRYRPGSRLFHRIYWMGRRPEDMAARKTDVYRETDPLVRILSNREAADDLDGQTGPYAQRLLPSVVTIDYPRLARARRMSSDVAEAAIQRLIEGDDHPVPGRRFFQFPGDDPRAFGKFLQANEGKAFAVSTGGETNTTKRDVDEVVGAYTNVSPHTLDYAGIATGAARAGAGYSAADDDWRPYCASLSTDLKERWQQHEMRINQRTNERIREEGDRFRNYVVRIAADYLDPDDAGRGPYPLNALRTQVRQLQADLKIVETFFGHGRGLQGRLPEGAANEAKYASIDRLKQRISKQESAMLRPAPDGGVGGLSAGQWLLLLLAAIGAGVVGWLIGGMFPGTRLGLIGIALAAGALAGVFAYASLRRRRTPLPELRRREELRLFRLYEALAFAYTGQALLREINASFIPRARDALDALSSRVQELNEVYGELLTNARARASEVFPRPLHSVGQIGSDTAAPDVLAADILAPLIGSIAITPQSSADDRIENLLFKIGASNGVPRVTGFTTEMADSIRERRQGTGEQLGAASVGGLDLAGLDAAIDGVATTSLAGGLPLTFEDALSHEAGDGKLAALDRHLAALVHKTPGGPSLIGQDRRRSAVECASIDATVKRLYVPSVEVQALVVQCLKGEGGTLTMSVRAELQAYLGADGLPLVAPELGATIALLSLWVPDTGEHGWAPNGVMDTNEGRRAHDTYYGVAEESKLAGFISQRERNFNVMPELSAAAAVELGSGRPSPLRLCVAARLLGSHPETPGPTLFELFYLLRADGAIRRQSSTGADAISPQESWAVELEGRPIPLLEQPVLLGTVGGADEFGGGRRIVNAFDALHDFMLYDGAPAGAMIKAQGEFVTLADGAAVERNAWAAIDKSALAALQEALVRRWWKAESRDAVDAEHARMREILADDVTAMDGAAAAADWGRTVAHVLDRGREKRRTLAITGA